MNLFLGKAVTLQLFNEGSDALLRLAHAVRARLLSTPTGYIRARPMTEVQQALMLQLGIRFDHGVRADDQLLRQRANAGQTVAGLQNAGIDGVTDLLHQLQVERLSAGGV